MRLACGRLKRTAVKPIICSSVVAERSETLSFDGAHDIFPERPDSRECYIVDDVIRNKIDGLFFVHRNSKKRW
jgi:hypothetical protein